MNQGMETLESEKETGALFRAWFNNRMTVLLILIHHIQQRDPRMILKIDFFLTDIEHHFVDSHAGKPYRYAFSYLHRYLKVYPAVTYKGSHKAVEMVRRIYEALGFAFNYPSKSSRSAMASPASEENKNGHGNETERRRR